LARLLKRVSDIDTGNTARTAAPGSSRSSPPSWNGRWWRRSSPTWGCVRSRRSVRTMPPARETQGSGPGVREVLSCASSH